jgi:hypothetical protein
MFACAIAAATANVALACTGSGIATGPAECKPVAIGQTGPAQITVGIGPCSSSFPVFSGAGAELEGPGYFKQLPTDPNAVADEGTGTNLLDPYTVTVTTSGDYSMYVFSQGSDPATCTDFYGQTTVSIHVVITAPVPVATPRPTTRPPTQATPAPQSTPKPQAVSTAEPTPLYPLPEIGVIAPGPALATRVMPLRVAPAGEETGVTVAYQDEVTVTGPPELVAGQYWYPVLAEGRDGYLAAGTGGNPWLVAAPTQTPLTTSRPAAVAQTPIPSVAANPQPAQPGLPQAAIVAGLLGTLLVASVAWWALRGGTEPEPAPAPVPLGGSGAGRAEVADDRPG